MTDIQQYRRRTTDIDRQTLKTNDPEKKILYIIYSLIVTGKHLCWQDTNKNVNREDFDMIGMELFWMTGVLVGSDELHRIWINDRMKIRKKLERSVLDGRNDFETEHRFKQRPSYPYLRFIRALFDDYESEIRKKYAGHGADDELIDWRGDQDNIQFEEPHSSDHHKRDADFSEISSLTIRSDESKRIRCFS